MLSDSTERSGNFSVGTDAVRVPILGMTIGVHFPPVLHCAQVVVWFGQAIDPDVINRSLSTVRCDVFLSIGTSAVVQPAASFVHATKNQGALTSKSTLRPPVLPQK